MDTSGKNEIVVIDDRPYIARGWMNGISAPVGTILGPNWLGENLTVVVSEPNRVKLAHTRPEDFSLMPREPRSVREHELLWSSIAGAAVRTNGRVQPVRSKRNH